MLNIETNASSVIANIAGISERAVNKAFAHSANGAITQTRTFILKALTEAGIKRKYAAAQIYAKRATPDFLNASLRDKGKRIPLSAFSPRSKMVKTSRGKRTGVTVQIGGVRELVPGGFLMTTKSGRVGIFQRIGQSRLPIKQVYFTKALAGIYAGTSELKSSAQAYAKETMARLFAHDLEHYKAKEGLK